MHPRNPRTRRLSMRIAHSEHLADSDGAAVNLFVFQHLDKQYTAIAEHLDYMGEPSGALIPVGTKNPISILRRFPSGKATPSTHRAWMERELYRPLAASGYKATGHPATAANRSESLVAFAAEDVRVQESTFWDSLNTQLRRDTFKQGKPPEDHVLHTAFQRMLPGKRVQPDHLHALALVFGEYTLGQADGLQDLKKQFRQDLAPLVAAIPPEALEFIKKSISVCSLMSPDAPLDLSVEDLMIALSTRAVLRT